MIEISPAIMLVAVFLITATIFLGIRLAVAVSEAFARLGNRLDKKTNKRRSKEKGAHRE